MDVIVIFNGLGNQMSQYAFYLQKKKLESSTRFLNLCSAHNGFELPKVFGIPHQTTIGDKMLSLVFKALITPKFKLAATPLKTLLNLLHCKIVKENCDYNFNSNALLPSKGITFYYGGWHSEKYFMDVEDRILEDFQFQRITDSANLHYKLSISNENSVSIHVRRGDYLTADNINLFGGVCTKEYFQKAIQIIEDKIIQPHFFVFSNDMAWVKTNLSMNKVTYVDCNSGSASWKDMYLMSLCKHNIISNSTFSWWGAWLNKNSNKIVISPERYLNNDESTDFYPDSWIKLSDY